MLCMLFAETILHTIVSYRCHPDRPASFHGLLLTACSPCTLCV